MTVPVLPAASDALAVQTLIKSVSVSGAVNMPSDHAPPFVQVTFGPDVIATLSDADSVEVAVSFAATDNSSGEKDRTGAI